MKRFTKLISSVLAALLTLSALVTVTNAKQFTDVPSTAPLLDAINYAVDNNFIEGTSSTTFSPNSYMTRGNMVLMLYRHSGETVNSTNTGFTDVPSSSVYARAVNWAVAAEITNGKTPTTFEPDTSIKRQDAAVMMYRYANYMVHRTDFSDNLDGFTDKGRVQEYALEAMQWAVGAGIIGGTSATTLEPRVALKRGAAAAMLQRYGISVVIPFDANNVPNDGKPHTTNDIFSRDFYGFTNVSDNFDQSQVGSQYNPNTSCYYIEPADMNLMTQYLVENDDVSEELCDSILSYVYDKHWKGSCVGMCFSTILDKAGQINVNIRQNNTRLLSQITGESVNAKIESLINYYHILQELQGDLYDVMNSSIFTELYNTIMINGLCQITIFGDIDNEDKIWGHSLVGYKSIQIGNNEYRVYAYDPNYPTMNTYLSYKIQNGSIVSFNYHPNGSTNSKIIDCIRFKTAREICEEFKGYDIDGDFNNILQGTVVSSLNESITTSVKKENATTNNMSLFYDMVSESKTTLYVTCSDDFTITNAKGEYLVFDSETFSFSGNMTIYRQAASTLDGFTHVLTVSSDDSYEIVTEANKVSMNVLSQDSFNGIEVNNAARIKISENDEIIVTGENSVVTSSYGTAKVNQTAEVK